MGEVRYVMTGVSSSAGGLTLDRLDALVRDDLTAASLSGPARRLLIEQVAPHGAVPPYTNVRVVDALRPRRRAIYAVNIEPPVPDEIVAGWREHW